MRIAIIPSYMYHECVAMVSTKTMQPDRLCMGPGTHEPQKGSRSMQLLQE